MKEFVLKLKGFNMFIGNGSGHIIFDKDKALVFSGGGQAKSWFKIIKETVPQLGKFKDYDLVKR